MWLAKAGGLSLSWIEGMLLGPRFGLFVKPRDVTLELFPVDAPHTSAADLYGGETPASNERVDLRHADVEVSGNVLECEKSGFDGRFTRSLVRAGRGHVREFSTGIRQQLVFGPVCFFLMDGGRDRGRV